MKTYDWKILAGAKKLKILWNEFKRLVSKKGQKISQGERKRENKVLVCIFFVMRNEL